MKCNWSRRYIRINFLQVEGQKFRRTRQMKQYLGSGFYNQKLRHLVKIILTVLLLLLLEMIVWMNYLSPGHVDWHWRFACANMISLPKLLLNSKSLKLVVEIDNFALLWRILSIKCFVHSIICSIMFWAIYHMMLAWRGTPLWAPRCDANLKDHIDLVVDRYLWSR